MNGNIKHVFACMTIVFSMLCFGEFTCYAKDIQPLDLPVLKIDLSEGRKIEDIKRDIYIPATASILNSDDFSFSDKNLEIRGRGNSSWNAKKKSYKLKLEEKQNLFGMMENEEVSKHWVLVSNHCDNTLFRNNLAFTLGKKVLDNIAYVSDYQDVDLYINNEYRGVYGLYEPIRVEKGRVDIKSEYGKRDTGYLLEYDMLVRGEDGIDYFRVNGLPYPFRIDSPSPEKYENEEIYRAQVHYMKGYMQQVWDAIKKDDFKTFCKLVEVDSVIDVYLVNELFKNSDVGLSSFYMYKEPGGKLFFGPIWDFDKSCLSCLQGKSYAGIQVGVEFDKGQKVLKASSPLFYELMKNPEFVKLVRNRWNDKKDEISTTITEFTEMKLQNTQSYSRNFEMWPEYSTKPFEQNIKDQSNWLQQRI